ncbi:hypothetical protein ACKFKF_00040 [Phormidesmis sp. 146-12]
MLPFAVVFSKWVWQIILVVGAISTRETDGERDLASDEVKAMSFPELSSGAESSSVVKPQA